MTRETKVGLVVGTGIILLIGIVVSDHLASQQRGQQPTAAPTGYQDYATGAQTRTIDPRNQSRPPTDNQPGATGNTLAPLPPSGNRTNNVGNGQRTDPIGLNNIGTGNNSATPGNGAATPGGTAGGPVIDRNLTNALGNGAGTPGTTPGNTATDPGSNVTDSNIPRGLATDLRGNGFLPQDTTPRLNNPDGIVTDTHRIPGPRLTEPLIHHVQSGESLWAISEKFYGDGRHYNEIARANADKLLPDGGVREGVRLVIPNRTIVTPGTPGTPGNNINSASDIRGAAIPDRGNTNTSTTPVLRTIKVASGDALSTIASRELGSMRHMQLIIEANKDQINDANDIKAGMTLRIPALPAGNATNVGSTNNAAPIRTITNNISTTGGSKTYTVQPRDNFTSIARTRLGDERRWKEIFELNKETVRTADALKAGVVILLPAGAR